MLKSLSIRNLVLIKSLDISFESGLCALTGETGAGKSILLDALCLALGARSSQNFIRSGADSTTVTAEFIVPNNCPILPLLKEHGLDAGDIIILRRIINQDGRTRAFINDQAVGVKLLQEIGKNLIEIHGQFDQLLETSTHRSFLDSFANLTPLQAKVTKAYEAWQKDLKALKTAEENARLNQENEEFLRYTLKELEELELQENEEEELTQQRTRLMHQAKLQKNLDNASQAISAPQGVEAGLIEAIKSVEKLHEFSDETLDSLLETLERAHQEVVEAGSLISSLQENQGGYQNLEEIEDRLFKLRAAARKQNCLVSQLIEKQTALQADLALIENRENILQDLQNKVSITKQAYLELAQELSQKRQKSAAKLDKGVEQELPPLKLERARFKTTIKQVEESNWSAQGIDHVAFQIATNPGSPFGGLSAIASGGERSRFMLALKVVLARSGATPSLVFDEIDSGVGGAVAHAIGGRLSRLAENFQVLVVTHSPQVAAIANHHFKIEKDQKKDETVTKVFQLSEEERKEEVARMLAGAHVTEEARAAAEQLLGKVAS